MVGEPWLVGAGIADVTGDPWGVGMMGYGMRFQRTTGILQRQRARAFVVVDRATEERVAFVVTDIGMFFRNVTEAVVARLDPRVYRRDNVMLTATHTHAGVGGYSCYRLYNMTTDGFQPRTCDAIVDGVVAAIERATADLAPGRLLLARGELHDASVNRSPGSFDRNPAHERRLFPDRIDPSTLLLRLQREGRDIGVVNWFATHGTSLCNRNTLISGDNKGYASWRWERDEPGLVAAFAQTNAGDMSPNVPDATRGPTPDDVDNVRIIGTRQLDGARALQATPGRELSGGISTGMRHVRMSALQVEARWCADGRSHRTGPAVLGAAFAAGTLEGPGASWCHQGVDANRLLSALSNVVYRARPWVRDAQHPKALLLPVGRLGWTADVLPVQLVRIGALTMLGLAHEVTIVAGLRLRTAVADALGVAADDVVVQGYANDYAGYLTTPEEYDAQRYEGGHTMFGRWQLPAYLQEVTALALALREGSGGRPHELPAARVPRAARPRVRRRAAVPLRAPEPAYTGGDVARVTVRVPDPRGPLASSWFTVERQNGDGWRTVADDTDWATTIEWAAERGSAWTATMTWRIPPDADGLHRFVYGAAGLVASRPFTVAPTSEPAPGGARQRPHE